MNPLYKIYCRIFQIGLRIALPVLPYRNPEIIDRISDVPLILKKANLKKPFIITDGNLSKIGAAEGLKGCLEKAGIDFAFYDGAFPNPTTDLAKEAYGIYKAAGCDSIIALGGRFANGSVKGGGDFSCQAKIFASQVGWHSKGQKAHTNADSHTNNRRNRQRNNSCGGLDRFRNKA